MTAKTPSNFNWSTANFAIKSMAWLLLGSFILYVLLTHIPPLLGYSWSECQTSSNPFYCQLVIHFWEIPMVGFNAFAGWFLLKKYTASNGHRSAAILTYAIIVNIVYFGFKTGILLDDLSRVTPRWQTILTTIMAVTSLGLAFYGIKAKQDLVNALHPIPDGFYHPSNEEELIALVEKARTEGKKIRCRGSAHSVAWAIYTDKKGIPNMVSQESPPTTDNINIMLDKYIGLEWLDKEKGIIEVEAGIHLGIDPHDPTHTSTFENSLLGQAFQEGFALSDVGGITHQTVAGFLATGSAGGSLSNNLEHNMLAFRIIDGTGKAYWIEKDKEEDKDLFNAVGVSLGLLGIISKVRFQLATNFAIKGTEKTTTTTDTPIDLFGPGTATKPSFNQYLEKTEYTRLLWWPQKGVDRIVKWEAQKSAKIPPKKDISPYYEFESSGVLTSLEQLGAALLYLLLGNKGFFKTWSKFMVSLKAFRSTVIAQLQFKFKRFLGNFFGKFLAVLLYLIAILVLTPILLLLVLFFSIFKSLLIKLYPKLIPIFQPLGKVKEFEDYMYRSLPMDNAAGDILMGTEFTEIWIPMEYTEQVMNLLKNHFDQGGYQATGYYATELYAGIESDFWMSPAYGGKVLRVDVFWYRGNEGNPALRDGFYRQFWELFRYNNIPFRLHWGKFKPEFDYDYWADFFQKQFPMWDAFMEKRKAMDPDNIFLTDYWQKHLFGVGCKL